MKTYSGSCFLYDENQKESFQQQVAEYHVDKERYISLVAIENLPEDLFLILNIKFNFVFLPDTESKNERQEQLSKTDYLR